MLIMKVHFGQQGFTGGALADERPQGSLAPSIYTYIHIHIYMYIYTYISIYRNVQIYAYTSIYTGVYILS